MSKSKSQKTKSSKAKIKPKREYTQNLTTVMPLVVCPHCKHGHDAKSIKVNKTYPNGNRRHFCDDCKKPFVSIRQK